MNRASVSSPEVRVQRPSVPDVADYFSPRTSPRSSFQRANSDTFALNLGALRRGSPFNANSDVVLPRFSPGLPDAPADIRLPQGRRDSYMDVWRDIPQRQRTAMLQGAALCSIATVGLFAGFVLGLWVALNHLDLQPRPRA